MKRPVFFKLVAFTLFWNTASFGAGANPAPLPSPVPSASPEVSLVKISPYERNRLRVEFKRAQGNELRALEHRHGFELKDLKASQAVRLKEWEAKETALRHTYFSAHDKSPERRAFIKDFIERRKAFLQILVEERNRRTQDQKVRQASIREDQVQRLRDFDAALQKGDRPPAHLWPQPGH